MEQEVNISPPSSDIENIDSGDSTEEEEITIIEISDTEIVLSECEEIAIKQEPISDYEYDDEVKDNDYLPDKDEEEDDDEDDDIVDVKDNIRDDYLVTQSELPEDLIGEPKENGMYM